MLADLFLVTPLCAVLEGTLSDGRHTRPAHLDERVAVDRPPHQPTRMRAPGVDTPGARKVLCAEECGLSGPNTKATAPAVHSARANGAASARVIL
jgi:hypothetical protein